MLENRPPHDALTFQTIQSEKASALAFQDEQVLREFEDYESLKQRLLTRIRPVDRPEQRGLQR